MRYLPSRRLHALGWNAGCVRSPKLARGGAVWQLVGLITRRSQVQILPPQPTPYMHCKGQPSLFKKLQPIEVGAVVRKHPWSAMALDATRNTAVTHFGSK